VKTSTKWLISSFFIICMSMPLCGRILGFKAEIVENRSLQQFPSFTRGSLVNRKFYKKLGVYLKDNLPFRLQLVRIDSWIDYHVFSDSSTPIVITGVDGWLFFKYALISSFKKDGLDHQLKAVSALAETVLESGREFRLIVAPNKSYLYHDKLSAVGKKLVQDSEEKRDIVRRKLNRNFIPGSVDLWSPFEKTACDTGKLMFPPLDRHWNSLAALVLTRELIFSLQPGLWDPDAVYRRSDDLHGIGELPQLMNLKVVQNFEKWSVDRTGVNVEQKEFILGGMSNNPMYKIMASSEEAAFYKGKTVILADSFIDASIDTLRSYMEEVYIVHWGLLDYAGDIIRKSDTIVVECVEDNFPEKEFLKKLSVLQGFLKE